MRAFVAIATVVAFVAGPLARAADGPAAVLPGYCEWSAEPRLDELFGFLDEADCASATQVPLDPRFTTHVIGVPEFNGPRAFGEPASESLTILVTHDPTPLAPTVTPQPFFATRIYRDYKAAKSWWAGKVNGAAQSAGDATIRSLSVGPSWLKDLYAAGMATSIDVGGSALGGVPEAVLALYVGPMVLLPGIVEYGEQLANAPAAISQGSGAVADGVRNGRFDQAAEGVAEVCGNVGILVGAVIPATKFGSGLTKGRPPITPFQGKPVPRGSSPSLLARAPNPKPFIVTEALIREKMKGAPLKSQQSGGVSLPRVQEYVDRLLAGEKPPAIRVDGNMIVDGNHRYIAGRIVGIEPEVQPWLGGRPSAAVGWEDLPVSDAVWAN